MQPSAPTHPAPTRQYRSGRQILLIVAGLVALLVWYLAARPVSTPGATATPGVETPSQVIGQDRHLQNPAGATVAVAASKADLDQVVRAVSLSDRAGLEQIMASGRVAQVPVGTAVHVVDTDTVQGQPVRQVRILSGEQAGAGGWVLASALTP